jgi:hypothetical protein
MIRPRILVRFKCCLILMILTSSLGQQFTFTDSTVPCTNAPGVQGYETITAINTDMETELNLISTGMKQPPESSYTMILCPFTTFDAAPTALKPILNNVTISCGTTGTVDQNCIFNGGMQHVQVQESTVATYPITTVTIAGITFQQFSGTAISGQAAAPATVVLRNCIWQDFSTNQVILIRGDNPMTVVVEDSIVRVRVVLPCMQKPFPF